MPASPWRWAAVGILLLALVTPLGLIAEGGAFGEDAPADLDLGRYGLNAVPEGLNRYNGFWSHTVLGDYGFRSRRRHGRGQPERPGLLDGRAIREP